MQWVLFPSTSPRTSTNGKPIRLILYTHKDFSGKILLVKRSIEESELIFVDSSENIIDSFFVNRNYEDLADTLESILVNGFDKTLENLA